LAAAVAEAKNSTVAPPKATPKLVRWYIQIGSFSKRENAMSLWESLREQGLPASLDTVQTDKGTSYRLRVGPELDGKKAAAMKARLDKQNIKAILVSE
jgi:DedD protein